MERSEYYIKVEQRIKCGEIMISDLERWLGVLLRQGSITPTEHEALLKLGWRISTESICSLLSSGHLETSY